MSTFRRPRVLTLAAYAMALVAPIILLGCSDGTPQIGDAGGGNAGDATAGREGAAGTAGSATAGSAGSAGAFAGTGGGGHGGAAGTNAAAGASGGAGMGGAASAGRGGATGGGASGSAGSGGGASGLGGAGPGGRGGTSGAGPAGRGGASGAGASGGSAGAAGRGGVAGTMSTGTAGTGGAPVTTGRIYYVTPTGKSTNDGRSFATAMDFATARAMVAAGETVLLQAGTYTVPYQAGAKNGFVFSKSGQDGKPIRVVADGGQALFDFAFPDQEWVQDAYGFTVSGSYWTFKGIGITRAGYQGAYVTGQHNTFEACAFFANRNTGLEINEGGAYTTVINCDAYRNYDPKKMGSMADGFGPKQTQGPGNKFIGCRAWENSDDGYDAFDSPQVVTFEGCWAFRNGVDVWNYGGFTGNGNGFKVGGNAVQANNKLTNCVSFGHPNKGFDQNNNTGGLTIYNCTAYNNGTNFGLGGAVNAGQQHTIKNNVSLGAAATIANATQTNNTWNSGFSVSAADFVSLDLSQATAARSPDGALPRVDLFRLKPGSALIDAGVNVGLPYAGSAPDVGAFESAP